MFLKIDIMYLQIKKNMYIFFLSLSQKWVKNITQSSVLWATYFNNILLFLLL